jgi:N-acetylglucosaminyldiphosphoundecaprenol N-acetyl-beta-D-mannosaminyltransferase
MDPNKKLAVAVLVTTFLDRGILQRLAGMIDIIDNVSPPARTDVLGAPVSAVNLQMAIELIASWIRSRELHYVCVTGVHGVMESWRDEELQRIHAAAGMVTPDGMPLVWLLKMAGHRHADRVYGPDLMLEMFAAGVEHGVRHFLYGSTSETTARLKDNLLRLYPGARIVGIHSPPIRSVGDPEDDAICQMINESSADIIWVGLGTPKQEVWMARHRDRLRCPVFIGVGAAFDVHAGVVRQAPRFIQRSGFEWLYRLALEPRRLTWRYLRNNPAFVVLILMQKMKL